jgi:hypothetical protein
MRKRTLICMFVTALAGPLAARTANAANSCIVNGRVTGNCTMDAYYAGTVVIAANYITFNCNWNTIEGNGTGRGIDLSGRTGVILKNCSVTNHQYESYLNGSTSNHFYDVTHTFAQISGTSGGHGVRFNGSSNNNTFGSYTSSYYNDDVGAKFDASHSNIFDGGWWGENQTDGFDLDNSNNNSLFYLEASYNNANGIEIDYGNGSDVWQDYAIGNHQNGISFDAVTGSNWIQSNTVQDNNEGIKVKQGSTGVNISYNTVCNNGTNLNIDGCGGANSCYSNTTTCP